MHIATPSGGWADLDLHPAAGVTFSDGSPLTGAEVAASLEKARTSALYAARFAEIGAITAGEGTVTVALTRANGGLPALLDIPIVKETGGIPLVRATS